MRTYHSSLEALEDRIAPAGLVKIAVAKGTVTITGSTEHDGITIAPNGPGALKITADAMTKLQFGGDTSDLGGSFDVPGYAGDLKVSLGAGDDAVTLSAGNYLKNVSLDGGDGTNSFTYSDLGLPGSFSISAKTGNDTVTGSGNLVVGHDISIKLGNGLNKFTSTATTFSSAGKLTFAGGTGVDQFTLTSTDTVIGGDATINLGSGSDDLSFKSTHQFNIFGKLSLTGGQKSNLPTPGGTAANYTIASDGQFGVRGDVSITTKDNSTGVVLGGGTSSNYAGKVAVTSGATLVFTLQGDLQFYYSDVTFKTKADASLTVTSASGYFIGGKFTYTGGAGVDNISMVADGLIVGNATLSLGAGDGQSLTFGGKTNTNVSVLGALSVSAATKAGGQNLIALEQILVVGKFAVTTGASADTVKIDDITVRGTSQVGLGAGADSLLIETQGGAYAGASTFTGAFKGTLGDGADSATFGTGAGNMVTFAVASTLDAGKDIDTVTGTPAMLTITNVP